MTKVGDLVAYKNDRRMSEPMRVIDVQKSLGIQIRRGSHTVWIRKSLVEKVAE